MRITNNVMVGNYLNSIQNGLQKINKLNNQITTQQEINKVSEDPYKAIKIMNLKNEINATEKYNANCDEIEGWLDMSDSILDTVGNLSSEIKALLVGVDDTLDKSSLDGVLKDINGKLEEIGNALNSTYLGNYIFSGSTTTEPPIIINKDANGIVNLSVNPKVNKDSLSVELANGVTYSYNSDIESILGVGNLDKLNNTVVTLSNQPIVLSDVLDSVKDMDSVINDTLSSRVLVGSKVNTVKSLKDGNIEGLEKLSATYSMLQDVDVVEKYIELTTANYVYQSSMQVGAKILQPTLLDYLR